MFLAPLHPIRSQGAVVSARNRDIPHGQALLPLCPLRSLRLALPLLAGLLPSCSSYVPDMNLRSAVERADYAAARSRLESNFEKSGSREREFVLDNMRLGMVNLAAGMPAAAEPPLFETFMTLRRQGINDDQTVAASFLGEGGTIFWKGEPFEQALAFTYTAVDYAALGQWDNARAAALASLFQLRSFGENERGLGKGESKTKEEIAAEAARRERQNPGSYERYLDRGYTPVKTDFAYGYLMSAIANFALSADPDRLSEAEDNFREAFLLHPPLREVADAVTGGRANAVLVVEYGRGPEKVRYGPDGSLSRFAVRTPSDARRLSVTVSGAPPELFPWACDVNQMSQSHLWNSFEDVRKAKSLIGSALFAGGVITATTGLGRNDVSDRTAQSLAGLGIALAGLALKATAGADLRHCEILPQRTYVAPIHIPEAGVKIVLSVEGDAGSGVMITDLAPPAPEDKLRLRYIRIPVQQSFAPRAGLDPTIRLALTQENSK